MSKISFELDAKAFDHLLQGFLKLGKPLEKALDDYLWRPTPDRTEEKVRKYMPVSDRNKEHAKHSKSLTMIDLYMGFVVRSSYLSGYKKKNRFGYLFFPETGRGYTQKNTGAQEFFARAIREEQPGIERGVLRVVNKMLQNLN